MTNVYLLWRGQGEEDSGVLGVFTTMLAAEAEMNEVMRLAYQEEYDGMIDNPWGDTGMKSPMGIDLEGIDSYFEQFGKDCWIDCMELKE